MPGPAGMIIGGALQLGAGIFGSRKARREAQISRCPGGNLTCSQLFRRGGEASKGVHRQRRQVTTHC